MVSKQDIEAAKPLPTHGRTTSILDSQYEVLTVECSVWFPTDITIPCRQKKAMLDTSVPRLMESHVGIHFEKVIITVCLNEPFSYCPINPIFIIFL